MSFLRLVNRPVTFRQPDHLGQMTLTEVKEVPRRNFYLHPSNALVKVNTDLTPTMETIKSVTHEYYNYLTTTTHT